MSFSPAIFCLENWPNFETSQFNIPKHYENYIKKILIPQGLIADRARKMAMDYYNSIEDKSKPILALCVLKGSAQFFHILLNELKNLISKQGNEENSCQIFFEFIRVKSYSNLESTGTVEIQGMDDLSEMKDRHLLIVEDIIDTG